MAIRLTINLVESIYFFLLFHTSKYINKCLYDVCICQHFQGGFPLLLLRFLASQNQVIREVTEIVWIRQLL